MKKIKIKLFTFGEDEKVNHITVLAHKDPIVWRLANTPPTLSQNSPEFISATIRGSYYEAAKS